MTVDDILQELCKKVESGQSIPRDTWIGYAFKLNALILNQAELLESIRQQVALNKLEALNRQIEAKEKRNVSMAELEVEATDEYRKMRIEETKFEQIKEFIRIAKKNSDNL